MTMKAEEKADLFVSLFLIMIILFIVYLMVDIQILKPQRILESNCLEYGQDMRYLLSDSQTSFVSEGRCYYPVPFRLSNGNVIRVPVEAEKFLDSVNDR